MRLTINIIKEEGPEQDEQDLLSLEVSPDTTIGVLKASVQAEARIPATSQHLYHNGQLLSDSAKTMDQLQITDGDMLALHVRDMIGNTGLPSARAQQPATRQTATQSQRGGYGDQDPELIRLQLLGNPRHLQQAVSQVPELAAVIEDPEKFARLYREMQNRDLEEQRLRRQQINDLNADPFDMDAQMRIEEMIRVERVQENLQNAIEHNPEVFGRVHMLYIDVEVNGHKVKAFVDSGAQATIMSPSCAESCGIMRLVDKRFAGIARGVGTATILGRVHSAQIKIGTLFLACSFTVMEGKDVDLLLGLDMLKRHQASIDLAKDKLVIQGVEVPFLGEADIPKGMEEAREEEPTVEGPGGTTIGARSGAVSAPKDPVASSSASPSASRTNTGLAAPSQQPSSSRPQQAPQQQSSPPLEPQSIDRLVALGFSRVEAMNALRACGGNVEFAAALLFQG